ncbi:hypothetical protein [Brucella tritici]|nr:hypothetical protein [Brucella tritici]
MAGNGRGQVPPWVVQVHRACRFAAAGKDDGSAVRLGSYAFRGTNPSD